MPRSLRGRVSTVVVAVGLALLMNLLLQPVLAPHVFPLFLAAIMVSAWHGGLSMGLLATALSAAAHVYYFQPSIYSFIAGINDLVGLVIFILVALLISALTEQRRQTEVALGNAKEAAEEAAQLKSEFISMMSHELRTPLHVIFGYIGILQNGATGTLSPQQLDIVVRIERHSRMLFDLINMVLDLNRLEAGRLSVALQAVRVAELLEEIRAETQGLCEQSGLACEWHAASELPPLWTDPAKLKVIIKNLLGNALKFTPQGKVTIEAQARSGGVEIRVSDTGIGIPPEAQSLIFEPFRQVDSSDTRPYSGSGLGLHIVQRLLGELEGTITVESEVGRGSTFRVWVPSASHIP